jgi:nicotinate-nucleotide--dimethylbenzimidazole phosphoribosyltransferase
VTGPSWQRPVPLIGDRTSAATRAGDPAGWAFADDVVAGVDAVMAGRRDIRRYRPDPVPDGILRAVLEAGHRAPSVGHSQPWRFVVVTQQRTRDRAALLADRERLRQAHQLSPDRQQRLLDLQLEGIREAPVGIVVACDRRTPSAGVLGRATFVDADLWSCACAIQNMWLAARARGLGMGWVTLFQPDDLTALLGIPDGVATLGWMCLGWPDERPPDPGLERAGWSSRLALDDVVVAERWPETGDIASPPSHLAAPDQTAVVGARDSGDDLLAVPGSLGLLDAMVNRMLAVRPEPPHTGALVLVGADHPVAGYGVSSYPASVTADVLAATEAGVSLGATAASAAGLRVETVRAVASSAGDLVGSDAMSAADVDRLVEDGRQIGYRLGADGLVCLGEVGIGNTTVAAALVHVLLGMAVDDAVGLGAGADAAMLARKRDVVIRAVSRARVLYGTAMADPRVALGALGGPDIAVLAGVVLGAVGQRAVVVLDGLVTSLAALFAVRLEPGAQAVLVAGQQSRERAHAAVLTELGLEPLLQLRLRSGEGVGACLAAGLLLDGLYIRGAAARVTEG